MSAASLRVIEAFESLPMSEKQIVIKEILLRLQPLDSGPLDDEEITHAADGLAAILEE